MDALKREAFRVWIKHEQLKRTDLSATSFKHHLEYLLPGELEEVIREIPKDGYPLGWHSLDNRYGTRSRREHHYQEMRANGKTP